MCALLVAAVIVSVTVGATVYAANTAAPQHRSVKKSVTPSGVVKKSVTRARTAAIPVIQTEKKRASVSAVSAVTHTALPPGALRVPFIAYTITAGDSPLTIRGVTVEQGGMSALGIFEAVLILDSDGNPLEEAVIRAHRRADISLEPVVIAPRASATFTLAADTVDDLSLYEGQRPTLTLVALDASEPLLLPHAPIVSLPVVSTVEIGSLTASRGGEDPAGQRTVYVQDAGIRFGALRLTASTVEDVELRSIAWRNAGTAYGTDVVNVRALINGNVYPAEIDGRTYEVSLPLPVRIPRGMSTDVVLVGDSGVTGAQRTVRFDVEAPDDIVAFGTRTKYFVGVGVSGPTSIAEESTFNTDDGTDMGESIAPFFYRGSTVHISPGALISVGK